MYIYMQRLTFLLAFILSLANCQTNDMVVYAPIQQTEPTHGLK